MIWRVEFDERARRELRRLDRRAQRIILRFFRERVATADDPRQRGRALRHDLKGLWRYRIGEYRAICKIEDQRITVLVLRLAHRKRVYHRS